MTDPAVVAMAWGAVYGVVVGVMVAVIAL